MKFQRDVLRAATEVLADVPGLSYAARYEYARHLAENGEHTRPASCSSPTRRPSSATPWRRWTAVSAWRCGPTARKTTPSPN